MLKLTLSKVKIFGKKRIIQNSSFFFKKQIFFLNEIRESDNKS